MNRKGCDERKAVAYLANWGLLIMISAVLSQVQADN